MAESREPTVAPIDRERVEEYVEAQPDVLKELSFGKYLSSLKEGRERAVQSPNMAQEQEARIDAGKPAFAAESIPGALDYHAQRLGLTGDEYRQKASDLGVSIEFFEDTVGRKGFSIEEAKKMAAERGVAAFMPEGRRKVEMRGATIRELGIRRLKAQGEEVPEDLLHPKGRDIIFSGTQAGFYGSGPGLFSDEDPLEELTKPGEFGYGLAAKIVEEYLKDDALSHAMEIYSTHEQGWADYVNDRVNRRLKQLPAKPSSEDRDAYDRWHKMESKIAAEARRKALQEIALFKTVGLWTAPVFVPYEIDDSGKIRVPLPDEMTLGQAIMPTLEIIGVKYDGKTRQHHTMVRQASALQHTFDMADLLQAGVTGVLGHITDPERRPDGEGLSDAFVRGIANRRNLVEYALGTDMAQKNLPGAIAAGGLGFLGAVLMPDLFLGFGAARLGRQAMDIAAYRKVSKEVDPMLKEMALARADQAAAIRDRDLDAIEATSRRVNSEEATIKKRFDRVMNEVDKKDAEVAQRFEGLNENIGLAGSAKLDEALPLEVSAGRLSAHPSHRRNLAVAAGGETIGRRGRFDTGAIAKRLLAARERLLSGAAASGEQALRNTFVEPLQVPMLIERSGGALDKASALELRRWVVNNIAQAADDPAAFKKGMQGEVRRLLGADELSDARHELHKLAGQIEKEAKRFSKLGPEDTEKALEAIDDALEALAVNAEARALGAVFVRETVLRRLNPFAASEPILPKLRATADEIPELTRPAIDFSDSLVEYFNIDRAQANMVARMLDAAANRFSRETGRDPDAWWQTRIGKVTFGPDQRFAPRSPLPTHGVGPAQERLTKFKDGAEIVWVGMSKSGKPLFRIRGADGVVSGRPNTDPEELVNWFTTMKGVPSEEKPLGKTHASYGLPAEEIDVGLRTIFGTKDAPLKVGKTGDAIDWLIQNSPSEINKKILRHIKGAIDPDLEFRITDARYGGSPDHYGRTFLELSGQPTGIEIVGRGYNISGMSEETIIHELLHAATLRKIREAYQAPAGSELRAAFDDMLEVRRAVLKEIKSRLAKLRAAGKQNTREYARIDQFRTYTLQHRGAQVRAIDEMISYAFTSPEFQDILKSIKVGKEQKVSALTHFVRVIRKLFGLSGTEDSALIHIIRLSDKFLDENVSQYVKPVTGKGGRVKITQQTLESPALYHKAVDEDGNVIVRSVTEFLDDGRAVIKAMVQPDVSSVIYEVGRILRRDLHADDLDVIVKWLRSQSDDFAGLTHEANRFAGVSDELLEEAEDLFARGFERYMREGVTPASHELRAVFEKLKQALLHLYRAVRPDVKLNDEVKGVFDRLLQEEAGAPREMLPTAAKVIREKLIGPPGEREVVAFAEMASEATRLGIKGKTADGLGKELARTGEIVFEKPIMFERGKKIGTITDDGRHVFTEEDVLKLQTDLEAERAIVAGAAPPEIGIRGPSHAFDEESATEAVRSALKPGITKYPRLNAVSRVAAAILFGGDAYWDIRMFPPTARRNIETASRRITEAIGDDIGLGVEGRGTPEGLDRLAQFLGGAVLKWNDGRAVTTSGDDLIGSTSLIINRVWNNLTAEEQSHLMTISDMTHRARKGNPEAEDFFQAYERAKAKGVDPDPAWATVDGLLEGKSQLFKDMAHAVGLQGEAKKDPRVKGGLIETLLYHTRIINRDGIELGEETSAVIARGIMDDIGDFTGRQDTILHATAVIAGNGAAERARQNMVQMGLILTEAEGDAWRTWINGGAIDAAHRANLNAISRRAGVNANFLPVAAEMFEGFYIPSAVKKRMTDALARYMIKDSSKTLKDTLLAGERELTGAFSVFYTFMKTRMTRGAFFLRQRYFVMNTFDHFTQMAIQVGFGPALVSTTRMLTQNGMVIPGVSRGLYFAKKLGAPEDISEVVREALQRGGDAAAQQVGKWLSLTKYSINVNPILEGSDEIIRVGNKLYRARDIRKVATEEGIFASFDTRALERIIRQERASQFKQIMADEPTLFGRFKDVADDFLKNTKDTAEAWAERERLGAMVTLMEMGYPPRVAARVTIDALYDYAGSMAKVDRAFLINMVLPFWAFQKNANKQVFDALFSPWGAYRLNVLRKSQQYGMDLISYIAYESLVDPYGVNVENLPEEVQANYWALRNSIEFGYGPLDKLSPDLTQTLENEFGPLGELDEETRNQLENGFGGPENVPLDVKRAMRMIFQDRAMILEGGRLYQLDEALAAGMRQARMSIHPYTIPMRDKAGRQTYLRDRPGAMVPLPRVESVVRYYQMMEQVNPNHMYMELFIPDSTIHAGMRHLTYVTALAINMGTGFFGDSLNPEATNTPAIKNMVEQLFPLERAPLLGPALDIMGITEVAPTKIHPSLVPLVESIFPIDLLKYPGVGDPWKAGWGTQMGYSEEEIRRLATISPDSYYLPAGTWSIAFNNAPVGLVELNKWLFDLEVRPQEATHIRGKILHWAARAAMGLDVVEIQRDVQARREDPRRKTTTTTPPY